MPLTNLSIKKNRKENKNISVSIYVTLATSDIEVNTSPPGS